MTRSSNNNPRARRWSPLSLLCAPASLLLTLQPQVADASLGMPTAGAVLPQLMAGTNRVNGLSVEELDDGTTVLRLQGTSKPTFNVYRLAEPDRLVVDIAKSAKGSVVPHVPLDTWACGRVTVGGVAERGTNLVRVVIELKREASYIVVPDGDALVVTVTPREVAPEQYFARKSAVKRRAELESRQRRTQKLEADASKLKAQATEEAQAAKARAEVAAKKVRSAEAVARKARSAEARARAAEAAAKKELSSAKSNRLAVRRALRKATKERESAETARRAADAKLTTAETAAAAKRKEAQRLLAAAEAVAKKRMAEAAAHRDAAKRELADARGSKKAAAAELEAARAEAAKSKAASHKQLEAAKALAARSKAASAKELAEAKALAKAAKAKAERAQRAASQADAASKKKLAEAEVKAARAKTEAERAKRAASRADDEAKKKLAAAEAAAKRAKAKALEAERAASRTDADAKKRLASAEAKAKAAKAEAKRAKLEATRAETDAKKKLAAAEKTAKARLAAAQTELTDAKLARTKAKDRLAEAERRAKKTEAQAQAKAASILAAARSQAAKEAAAELASAKVAAEAVVAKAKTDAAALKKKRLAEAEADAKAKVARAEKTARTAAKERLAAAESEAKRNLAQARKKAQKDSIAQAELELARVRKQGKSSVASAVSKARAQAQADAKTELVAARKRIEADATRRIALAEKKAQQAETAAQSKLNRADAMLATASKTLAEAKADRASAQKLQQSAEKKLAAAEQARERAESEKASAQSARKAAERTLAQAREAATDKRGLARRKANAQLAQAQRERDAAVARQLAAAKKLGSVERRAEDARKARETARKEKEQAEAQLASLTLERDSLKSKLADRDAALAAMKQEVSAATKARASAEARANARPATKKKKHKAKGAAKVRDVRFEHDGSESRVIVEFDGAVRYDGMTLTPTIQLLKFSGAKLAKKLERSLDASKYDGSVRVVTSFAEGDDAKVIVSTHGPVRPRLEEKPGELVWHFPNGAKAKSVAAPKVAAQTRREPQAVSVDGAKVGGFASVPGPRSNMAPATSAQPDVTRGRRSSRGRWRGERIDIELQDAPIKDVLLLFSDIGRVNIVAGDGVDGSVTMKLNSVPWDQALDIILRSLKLGSAREGNVIRVATLDTLEEEQRQAIERANARVQLKPLETRLVPLSYATVDEMVPKVQSVLSPRGTVTPDSRTNTLIIMDVAANIALAQDLVKSLDTQTPQVLIEARIVEARTTFTRQLGIQWGFDFTASPGTGNPTGLLFPNSVGVGGGGTGTPADTRGLLLPGAAANPNYAVDLPAPVGTGAGGAVGMSFGSISGNLNTNLRLSAAESTGEVRIISAPKVVTLDNTEANIEQGVQIPISQVSAQGVNTRFVNATLSLTVTPHVTNEGAVLLDVDVQKNEADFVNTGARGDPTILTRSANSRMLVNDADTAVIGGIYTRNKAVNYTKIPWLADVPIVGWFFKNKSEADTRSEVLIFLTPKIVNRASSIGG